MTPRNDAGPTAATQAIPRSPASETRASSPAVQLVVPPDPAPSSPLIRGYAIDREIGRGGMGVVYRARQLGFDRIVALKVMLSERSRNSEDLARFRTETEAFAHL